MLLKNFTTSTDALKDRVILVTGASDGIGRAVALCYAAHGAQVVLLGKTQSKLDKVYDEMIAMGGQTPALLAFNLENNNPSDYQKLADAIDDNCHRLDGLVHCAGMLGDITLIEHYAPEVWQKVMQVNLHSVYLLTHALLPLMKRSTHASIIFTSSSVGRQGRAHWGAYAVSKFAVEGFMQVLADEFAATQRIRVNSINPGATRTAMRASAYPAEDPQKLPLPTEITGAYLYLMSEAGKAIHGQALNAQQ